MYVPGSARYPWILAYHEISRRFHLGINNIHPHRFRSHLDFFQRSEIPIIPLRGLNDSHPARAVCLTFDDGYLSFYDEVLPILMEYKAPATLFIITDYVGCRNKWDVTLGINSRQHLHWHQIEEIARLGIEIGSHGRTHRDLTRFPLNIVEDELRTSKKVLEDHLGREITSFAIPFGTASLDLFVTARNLGYQEICGGIPGLSGPFPGVLPRMPVYRGDSARSLMRKMSWNLAEILRLKILHSCSLATRCLKNSRKLL